MGKATEAASLRRHYREIYRYVRRRSQSASDAEEVTQDVFADAARALRGGETADGLPVAWLCGLEQLRAFLVEQEVTP